MILVLLVHSIIEYFRKNRKFKKNSMKINKFMNVFNLKNHNLILYTLGFRSEKSDLIFSLTFN